MKTASDWRQMGRDTRAADEAAHVKAGLKKVAPMRDNELRDALECHFADDLRDPKICNDQQAALDELVAGYRNGG
jgi:hypothetical protein